MKSKHWRAANDAHMKKRLLPLALLLSPLAAAQSAPNPYLGANITRTYTLDDLMTRPGLIRLGKGDMVVIDLPSDVSAVVTPQAGSMDIPAPLGNVVVLTAKVSSGSAQMLVQLDSGKYANFALNFTSGGNGMKRVLVTDSPNIEYAPTVSTPQNSSMPAYTAPSPASAPITVVPTTPASASPAALAPLKTIQATLPISRAQPEWLLATAKINSSTLGDSVAVTITNIGTRAVTFTPDATLTVDGQAMRGNADGNLTVQAGQSRSFLVNLPARVTPNASVTLDWAAFDQGSNTYYHVTPHS